MKARPILFSAPMIRALLDGTKTQTRRIVKPQPSDDADFVNMTWETTPEGYQHFTSTDKWWDESGNCMAEDIVTCPYGMPSDLLWVRESYYKDNRFKTAHKADCNEADFIKSNELLCIKLPWKPSIHMPRCVSRITLEVTSVRVERLQDISESDAIAEGIIHLETDYDGQKWYGIPDLGHGYPSAQLAYKALWESINGEGSWEANPWLWVIDFDVHKQNVDAFLSERQAA